MVESMVESLRRDMDCESLLDCVHGLKDLDRVCFEVVVENGEAMSVDQLADVVDRERSTTYRSVRRLLDAGLVEKEQVNYEEGSYYHVYSPADPGDVAADMQRTLNDWYAKMGQLVREFEDKYA
ncbi:MAG TPA: helix-turn-helix domain-containing protein, partial [Halobacteriales archaeon]|nr:helix-turn-helix domain-containing protein [Halobacteriales archaeon]